MTEQKNYPDDDDDDSPMVYKTPVDYAAWAKKEKENLLSQGQEAILMSEVKNGVPRVDGESEKDYAKKYFETMNDMIKRGVHILNDQCTHDVVADRFCLADGHTFDLGPSSGATKREFREFSQWFGEDATYSNCPPQFLKFESSQTSAKELSLDRREADTEEQ